jgi:hypothetical protein
MESDFLLTDLLGLAVCRRVATDYLSTKNLVDPYRFNPGIYIIASLSGVCRKRKPDFRKTSVTRSSCR